MKLLKLQVISAESCGGLLDDLDCRLRSPLTMTDGFDPICFVGPNGAGKSQLLQVLAEVFQSIFHVVVQTEERIRNVSMTLRHVPCEFREAFIRSQPSWVD